MRETLAALDALVGPDDLQQFVIYKNPTDYPGKFVVREWIIRRASAPVPLEEPTAVVNTLLQARGRIPEGMVCIERSLDDDPAIVEVWL